MGLGRGWVAFIAASAAPAAVLGQTPAPVTAFVHVAVIPMDRERVLHDQTVLVQDGHITALGPATRVAVPAGATRVEGRGRFLTPGLADMHVHLRGVSQDSARLRDFLFAMLADGITTMRDMHSGGPANAKTASLSSWTLAVRGQLARGELLGPRLYTAGDPDYSSPAAAAQSVAQLKAGGHDFVKVYDDVKTPEIYDSIKASANRVELRMAGHVPVNGLDWVIAAPFASVEHSMGWIARYLAAKMGLAASDRTWLEPGFRFDPAHVRALARAMQRAGVWACPTSPDEETMQHLLKELYDDGMRLITATDIAADGVYPLLPQAGYTSGTILHTMEQFVEAGLTPYQALATSTHDVAEFLGTLDSSGTIAVGKRADLVLVRANPLRDISHMRTRVGVMIGGRWLGEKELDRGLEALTAQWIEQMRRP